MTEKLTDEKFEESFEKLKQIVEKLEKEAVPLDQAMALFREGQRLSKICADQLDQAELTIKDLQSAVNG